MKKKKKKDNSTVLLLLTIVIAVMIITGGTVLGITLADMMSVKISKSDNIEEIRIINDDGTYRVFKEVK